MKITVNSQSSIRIESDLVVRFDPFELQDAPHDADVVFVTHDHRDHYSPADIEKVRKSDTVFVVPTSLAGKTGGEEVVLCPGDTAEVRGLHVEAVNSYNLNKDFHPKDNGWLGYIVTVEGKRIYVCGDSDCTDEAKAVQCDILCVPIGGTYTMDPAEAAELALTIMPEAVVPTHYGSIVGTYGDFEAFCALIGDKLPIWERVEDARR